MKLEHLPVMTDDTGILQHATFNVPRYADGYCLDDNARALAGHGARGRCRNGEREARPELTSRYLGFISYAFDQTTGRFRNFMSYNRTWIEDCGSEDSQGRSLWALGAFCGSIERPGRQEPGRPVVSIRAACGSGFLQPESLGLCAAWTRRVSSRLSSETST